MIIGITGGTGSGKTTLLELIREQGGLVLDCDAIYHQLLQEDRALLTAIEARFPGTVAEGVLDRKELGNRVFRDEKALLALNRITHSGVKSRVVQLLEARPALAAIDAIALFEGGLAELCTVTVAVIAPRDVRIARLMARDGISEDYAARRISAQKEDDWFRAQCSYVLENTGTKKQFRDKCLAFLAQLDIIKEKPI